MKKSFKYRIFPNKAQTTKLNQTIDSCRWLYNYFLDQRKASWKSEQKSLSYFDQQNMLVELKKEHINLMSVYSQTLCDVTKRIDLAFKAFFRRVKSGEKPGYPRFRSKFRYDSFTYPQFGFKLLKNVVQLSKIGGIKIKLHRPIEGIIKTCTVKRTPTGKWFVAFVCDVNHEPIKQPINPVIGIDMGLKNFATLSNEETIKAPQFFRKEEKALTMANRKLSKKKRGAKDRARARRVVARIHERIKWKRHNFAHQLSRKLVDRFNTICVEDLSINDMQKENFRCINKSIGDAAWRMFLECLRYKAEWAGTKCVQVNPAYTSQTCSDCGTRYKLKLSNRIFHCDCCDLSLNRDVNAALNILTLGMQGLDQPLAVS